MTGHRVDDFLSQNHPFRIILFYEFPNNMVCSNEVFNDISGLHYSPEENTKLLVGLYGKWKLLVRITFKLKKKETKEKFWKKCL